MFNSEELYQQANQLPPLEKLHLAELLLADLDTSNPEIDAIWHNEAKKMTVIPCEGIEHGWL